MRQPKKIDHARGGIAKPGVGAADQPRKHRTLMFLAGEDEVVAHRELRKDLEQLKSPAHAEAVEVAGPHPVGWPAVNTDLAGSWAQLTEYAVEQCGLARTVRSDDAENLTFLHIK